MASNYPPGVTGNEFEISGPEWEREQEHYCPACGEDRMGVAYGHSYWAAWACDTCGDVIDLEDDEGPDRDDDDV